MTKIKTLPELEQKYIEILTARLAEIEKPALTFGFKGIENIQNTLQLKGSDADRILKECNTEFVNDINSKYFEQSFTDDERLLCYKSFCQKCSTIVSDFNKITL